jgi:uncharacterized membrane protein YhaH (DUF805 family)
MKFQQITSWQGEIGRKDYLLWGTILFAFKYNLDRLTAWLFGKGWFIVDYLVQVDNLAINELSDNDLYFYIVLILQLLPFIWFGTNLTVKRLRNAKIATWLVLFFFLPFINFILFLLLSIIPSRSVESQKKEDSFLKLLVASKYGSAALALTIVVIFTLAISYFLINYLKEYGWSLFVGIPFFLGFGSVLLHGQNRNISYREAMAVMFASIILFNISVFILVFEGVICLTMAFTLLLFIGWMGASVGYAIHQSSRQVAASAFLLPLIVILLLGRL